MTTAAISEALLNQVDMGVFDAIDALLDVEVIFTDTVTFLSEREQLDGKRLFRSLNTIYIDLVKKDGHVVCYRMDNDYIFNIYDRLQVLRILEEAQK